MKYTYKEECIIKQCNEGPFHTLVTELTLEEFDNFVNKLIFNGKDDIFPSLVAIYTNYNRNKIIDYFINKGDESLLLSFLDYCNDFQSSNNELNQKYIVDKLIEKNDKVFIENILKGNNIYFLTDKNEKDRLLKFIS